MADRITPEHRSWNMRRIKGKDTSLEVLVRSWLFSQGYRFRKNDKRFPGTPDIVLPKYKTAIFINGCFWHHHSGCKLAYIPKSRTEFWMEKFQRNKENDVIHMQQLNEMGWRVITIWECQIKSDFEKTMSALDERIQAEF